MHSFLVSYCRTDGNDGADGRLLTKRGQALQRERALVDKVKPASFLLLTESQAYRLRLYSLKRGA